MERGCFSFSCGCLAGGCLVALLLIFLFVGFFSYGYWVGMFRHPNTYGFIYMHGDGMSPTIPDGSWVLVDRTYYQSNPIKSGDIILVVSPNAPEKDLRTLLRVAGLPGETITVDATGEIVVNGNPLAKDHPLRGINYRVTDKIPTPTTLEDNQLLLLNENPLVATDSRLHGPVSRKDVRGKAISILFPPNRIGRLTD